MRPHVGIGQDLTHLGFVPAVRPLVALGTLVLIVRGAEVDYELSMRSPR
jgi:hypothetical protein